MNDTQTIEAPEQQTPVPEGPKQPAPGKLPDEYKTKLINLAAKMEADGKSSEEIQAVVDFYKKKFSAGSTSSPAPSKTAPSAPVPAPAKTTPASGGDGSAVPAGGFTDLTAFRHHIGIKTPTEQYDDEIAQSQAHVADTWNKIDPLVHKVVAEDKLAATQTQAGQSLNRPGSDATQTHVSLPTQLPAFMTPTDQEVQQAKATPEGQKRLLARQVQEYRNQGKTEEAGKLQAALYNVDHGAADTDEKARQRLQNTEDLKKGILTYSPVTQKLIKPTGLGESITDAWNKRNDDIDLFKAADDLSDTDLAKHLDYVLQQQNDPDKPQHVPKSLGGAVGQFVGDQGPIGAVATAAAAIPVVGEATAGGLYAHEMGRRTYGQELLRTYADLRQQHPDMTPEQAVTAAKAHAARAGLIDAVTGAALGASTGALGKEVKVAENEVPGMAVNAIPKPTGMLTNAVAKGYDFLKESLPAGAKNAALFGGGTVAKNVSGQAAGDKDRDATEGVLDAAGTALGYHLAFGLIGKGLAKLQVGVKKAVLQGMSKLPTPEVNAIAAEQVKAGVLTPEEGQQAVVAIGEHKELDAQVPDKVKNDEVRLDLQKKIQRRQQLEQELATVNKAFHPEVKEKIAALDEKMNEIASSPEAKQETPVEQPVSRGTTVEPSKTTDNEQPTTTGERPTLPESEKQTEQSTGGTEPGSAGGVNRSQEVRQEEIPATGQTGKPVKTTEGYAKPVEPADKSIKPTDKFQTWDLGDMAGKPENDEAKAHINGVVEAWDKKPADKEGETFGEFTTRVIPEFEKTLATAKDGTTIVTHSSVLKAMKVWDEMGRPDVEHLSADEKKEFATKYNESDTHNGDLETFQGDKGDVHVIRHGQTEDNKLNNFRSGNTNLTDKGEQQAVEVGKELKAKTGGNVPQIISSDLPRAVHTSNIIHEQLKSEDNAVRQQPAEKILQREPGTTGSEGSERGRVEQGKQGEKPAGESAPAPEKPASKPVQKEKVAKLTEEAKKIGLSEDEKFVLQNSYPYYKKKFPEATQDEYNVKRGEAYDKQKALRSSGMAKYGETAEGTVKPFENTAEAVNFIKTHLKDDPIAQRVMKLVEPVLKDTKIEAADFSKGEHNGHQIDPRALGYSFPDKSIIINWDAHASPEHAAMTTLHEMVHNATRETINSNKAFRGELDTILDQVRRKLKLPEGSVGDALIQRLVANGTIDGDKYGGSNPHELIAEVFTNKKFQDMLKGIEYKGDNLLTRTFQAIAKYFSENYRKLVGAKSGISVNNVADYLQQLTEKTVAGKELEIAVPATGEALPKLEGGSEEERQLKQLMAKHADDLDDDEIKEAFVNAGHDPADIDRLMKEVQDERAKGAEQLIREAHEKGVAALAAGKLAPKEDVGIAKASVGKTLKRWFYDKQDEVTDVKSIIRQNKGKEEHELDMIYKASNKARDFWNTVPKEKQEAFILGMERPDLQKGWTPDMKSMADVYRDRLQKTFDTIKKAMPDINFIEDYFPHFWEKPDEVRNFFAGAAAKNPLEGGKGFAQKRSFDNILPGIEKGYKLTTTNPEELVRLAEANAWKFQTARNIFEDMKKMGYLKFSTAKDLPEDWKGVDDKLFNRMGAYVTKDGDANIAKGQYLMPPEVAKLMNNYLSLGIKSPIKNVVNRFNNIKNLFQLGIGAFHFTTTGIESLINGVTTGVQKISTGKPENIGKGLLEIGSSATVVPNIIQSVRRGLKAREDYYKGNMTADVQNLIDVNAKVGKQKMYSLDTWYNTKKAFGDLKANGFNMKGAGKLALNALLTLPEAINKPLMEHWVPSLKVGGYLRSLDSEIASRGKMSPRELQQAKEKIWDSMDDRLGQVVYDNVFMNKAAKDLAFMAIRSAGWTGGTIRTAIKGVGEIPLSGSRLVKGKGLSQRTADLIAMPLTVGFFGGMLHYLNTGQPPQEMKDYFFPKDGTTNPDGTDHRVTLPSYMKDYLAYGKSPAQTLVHKTSSFLNETVELYQNKDFYGEKIYNEDDPIFQKGLDVLKYEAESLEPFSFKKNPNAGDIPMKQQVEQKFGLMAAPKEWERSETQNAIMKAYVNQLGGSGGAKTHEQMEQQIARRHLYEYLYNGGTWEDADDDLKEKANVSRVQEFVNESKINPYERYFKHLNKDTRQQLFDAMPDDEQETYKKYMK